MGYNCYLQFAAVGVVLILLVIHCSRKRLPILSEKLFMGLLWTVFLACLFSGFREIVNSSQSCSITLKYITNIISFAMGVFLMVVYYDYMLAVFNYRSKKILVSIHKYFLPLIALFMILSAPFNHLYFYISINGVYHDGWVRDAWNIYYTVSILFVGIVAIVRDAGRHVRIEKIITVTNIVFVLTSLMCHYYHIGMDVRYVFAAMSVYVYYLALQSLDFFIDITTEQFNMEGFISVMNERVAYGQRSMCLLVRVKNFNALNRTYEAGRLKEIQRIITEIIFEKAGKNKLYHISNSTFAIILNSEEELVAMYEELKKTLPDTWMLHMEPIPHEYSFYRVAYPEDTEDINELMQRIHYARSDHRGHHFNGELIHLKNEELKEAAYQKMVAHRIEQAIMDKSLELNYQPIYSIEDDRITSLEVLSRLKDEQKKYINPEYFIHVAEMNHTIIELSRQMFEKACDFAVRNDIFSYGIKDININLSPVQCAEKNLVQDLKKIADRYGLSMDKFHFEITESQNTKQIQIIHTLSALQEEGAKIALDDFGTGYSNIASIMLLPIDFVKIDKSLLWSYAEGKNQFLNELMPMIKDENKKIIAEGIETEEHIAILKRMGGDFLQGYFYSKPLSEEKFIQFLQANNS